MINFKKITEDWIFYLHFYAWLLISDRKLWWRLMCCPLASSVIAGLREDFYEESDEAILHKLQLNLENVWVFNHYPQRASDINHEPAFLARVVSCFRLFEKRYGAYQANHFPSMAASLENFDAMIMFYTKHANPRAKILAESLLLQRDQMHTKAASYGMQVPVYFIFNWWWQAIHDSNPAHWYEHVPGLTEKILNEYLSYAWDIERNEIRCLYGIIHASLDVLNGRYRGIELSGLNIAALSSEFGDYYRQHRGSMTLEQVQQSFLQERALGPAGVEMLTSIVRALEYDEAFDPQTGLFNIPL